MFDLQKWGYGVHRVTFGGVFRLCVLALQIVGIFLAHESSDEPKAKHYVRNSNKHPCFSIFTKYYPHTLYKMSFTQYEILFMVKK